jgi:hypothetical protein
MAHFAQIEDNTVVQVTVINNEDILDTQGVESEEIGSQLCQDLFGGTWIQTSYNSKFRVRFAGVGYVYDETRDAFLTAQPYPSWILTEDTLSWVAPVSDPQAQSDGVPYTWDESSISWVPYVLDPALQTVDTGDYIEPVDPEA